VQVVRKAVLYRNVYCWCSAARLFTRTILL